MGCNGDDLLTPVQTHRCLGGALQGFAFRGHQQMPARRSAVIGSGWVLGLEAAAGIICTKCVQ